MPLKLNNIILLSQNCLLFMIALLTLSFSLPEDAEARRRGFSRSRSRSSSTRSRSRSTRRRRTPTRAKSDQSSRSSRSAQSRTRRKGMGFGGILNRTAKPRTRNRHSAHSAKPRPRSRNFGHRPRYRDRGSWWGRTSKLKRRWQRNQRPRRRFRRSFFNRYRPILETWDAYFLASGATSLFWYHHWKSPEIQEALYEDHVLEDEDLATLELEVKAFEAKGIPRDPEYLPEGIGPEDAYSDDYLRDEQRRRDEDGSGIAFLGFVAIGLGVGFRFFRG